MALRFMDSFDHYVTADGLEKWTSQGGTPFDISAGNGRRGTASARFTVNEYLQKTLDNQATWVVGFAYRATALGISSSYICEVMDTSQRQIGVIVDAAGSISITRDTTVIGTASVPFRINTYLYIELFVTIHNTAGIVMLAVNGVTVLSLTSQDTQASANAYASAIRIGSNITSLGTVDIDDVYICDGTGSTNNTFLGDCRVDALFPNGEGSNSAWTISTGTTHSTLVDETAPNDDTDYLSTSTASARDSHTLTNLSAMTAPVVKGIQHSISARKDDAGTRQIKSLLKSGATTEAGVMTHALSTSYAYYSQIWEQDPNTDAAWATTAIDALEAGMENV